MTGGPDVMTLRVSHATQPEGKIVGFKALWVYYVRGFDPAKHCQICLKGEVAKNFNTNTARSGVDLALERAREFPFVYLCGVAAGPKELRGERNLHVPMRYAPGSSVQRVTYNGYHIEVGNAEALPIPALRDYWIGLPLEHHQCKNFQFGVAYLPEFVPELQPVQEGLALDRELWRLQELFRGVILSRVREGQLSVPRYLPRLSRNMLRERESRWFPVPGMAGGFAYRMQERSGQLVLIAESWSRMADGSGMRHRVTATEAVLEEVGFV